MSSVDVFSQINNAILDLQAAQQQTFELPLKKLARLLSDAELEGVNKILTDGVDLERFLEESEGSGKSFSGATN